MPGENPLNRSARAVEKLCDIVYSPNKYRETEGIKVRRLGFALSEASLQQVAYSHGINMSIREMTEAQKATLRYTAMVEQAADMGAIGDMSRTLMTPANAIRILKQQLNELTRSLGSLFIPILMKVIPYVPHP